ncbi:MAG: arginine--tRNA ligase [Pseudomonadota bacterium]|nr:arginine--tRNA ligase [Pseudomonadota bacterium]
MNEVIKQELVSKLNQLGWGDGVEVQISRTKSAEHGDYSSNIAMILAKKLQMSPMKIARQIQSLIEHPDITRVDVASPGFLNFFTSRDFVPIIRDIIDQNTTFFSPNIGMGQSIYLEYVSANPTGPLHVGHGRSAAYGSSLANILKETGFTVHKEYYVNDAGLQIDILTTSMWLCIINQVVPAGCYTGDYLKDLVSGAPEILSDTPQNLPPLLKNWPKEEYGDALEALIACCQEHLGDDYPTLKSYVVDSITENIKSDLETFGVTFDRWFHESSLVQANKINQLIDQLQKSGHVYEKDGALWFKSEQYGDEKDRVLKRSNGIWTYFANDLAYHYAKCQEKPHRIVNIFGADHHGYVPRIVAGLQALGLDNSHFKCILIQFANLYRGKEKLPMSTRSGQFITLKTLYDEVSVDAARFFYCMRRSDQHLDFDLELAKSQNNQNPVYYIQYAHARIQSIFNKHGQYIPTVSHWQQPTTEELAIIEHLSLYPDLLVKVSQNTEVYRLPQYLLETATKFHRYYNNTPVLSDDIPQRYHRLLLCYLIATCIKHGLSLLGVNAPESM